MAAGAHNGFIGKIFATLFLIAHSDKLRADRAWINWIEELMV